MRYTKKTGANFGPHCRFKSLYSHSGVPEGALFKEYSLVFLTYSIFSLIVAIGGLLQT